MSLGCNLYEGKRGVTWEDAILEVIKKRGGVATLKELYRYVPEIKKTTTSSDVNHVIRAYLRRMTKKSGKLKRVGLGIYALPDVELKQNLFEDIQKGKSSKEIFKNIKKDVLHSYVEGMLVELGNIYGYLTYTADQSVSFNGKFLKDIATLERIPDFTSPKLLDVIKNIDVIWFSKRAVPMPKHAFEVEITSDFSKAVIRMYQLRDFRTNFYVIAPRSKYGQFEKRMAIEPYSEIRDRIFFRTIDDIFSLYEYAIKHNELKEKIIIET